MTGTRKGAPSPSPRSISLSTMNLSLSGIILVSRASIVELCFRTMGPADVKIQIRTLQRVLRNVQGREKLKLSRWACAPFQAA